MQCRCSQPQTVGALFGSTEYLLVYAESMHRDNCLLNKKAAEIGYDFSTLGADTIR